MRLLPPAQPTPPDAAHTQRSSQSILLFISPLPERLPCLAPRSCRPLAQAVTTAIALQQGMSSALFAVALCFSVIVMYDAMGVRRHAGLQAEVLNVVVEDLLEDHPVSEKKLKEVLGHTPRQVRGRRGLS